MRSDLHRLIDYLQDDPYFTVDILYTHRMGRQSYKFRFRGEDLPVYVDLFPFDHCGGDAKKLWTNFKKLKAEMVKEFRALEKSLQRPYRISFHIPPEDQQKIDALFAYFADRAAKTLNIGNEKTDQIVYGYDTVFLSDWEQVFSLHDVIIDIRIRCPSSRHRLTERNTPFLRTPKMFWSKIIRRRILCRTTSFRIAIRQGWGARRKAGWKI